MITPLEMTVITKFQWHASSDHIDDCRPEKDRYGQDCESYVNSAVKKPQSTYLICASSAKTPACRTLTHDSSATGVRHRDVDS